MLNNMLQEHTTSHRLAVLAFGTLLALQTSCTTENKLGLGPNNSTGTSAMDTSATVTSRAKKSQRLRTKELNKLIDAIKAPKMPIGTHKDIFSSHVRQHNLPKLQETLRKLLIKKSTVLSFSSKKHNPVQEFVSFEFGEYNHTKKSINDKKTIKLSVLAAALFFDIDPKLLDQLVQRGADVWEKESCFVGSPPLLVLACMYAPAQNIEWLLEQAAGSEDNYKDAKANIEKNNVLGSKDKEAVIDKVDSIIRELTDLKDDEF
ncbi:MAG: hypothetical protein AAF963_03530 [Bacteroidota bacterium]